MINNIFQKDTRKKKQKMEKTQKTKNGKNTKNKKAKKKYINEKKRSGYMSII